MVGKVVANVPLLK